MTSSMADFAQTLLAPLVGPADTFGLSAEDLAGVRKSRQFDRDGRGYSSEHATRPSTIAHLVASSPVALLAWVGGKISRLV